MTDLLFIYLVGALVIFLGLAALPWVGFGRRLGHSLAGALVWPLTLLGGVSAFLLYQLVGEDDFMPIDEKYL
jgi:hypothetical protein